MAYVKLDCGILDSSLWIDRDAREIFITALLLARPQEYRSEIPQIEVAELRPSGWAAPPGWYGLVAASGPGIIRRAGVEPDRGIAALIRLGSPDPDSRSQDYEGRRLIRIDGGYIALKYCDYRDRDHTAAERMRRYRERKNSSSQESAIDNESRSNITGSARNNCVTLRKHRAESIEQRREDLPVSDDTGSPQPKSADPCPHQQIIDLYHEILPMLPKVKRWTAPRQALLRQRWRENPDLEGWMKFFHFVADSPFLTGRTNGSNGHPPFIAYLEWIIRPQNFTKIIEGHYHHG